MTTPSDTTTEIRSLAAALAKGDTRADHWSPAAQAWARAEGASEYTFAGHLSVLPARRHYMADVAYSDAPIRH